MSGTEVRDFSDKPDDAKEDNSSKKYKSNDTLVTAGKDSAILLPPNIAALSKPHKSRESSNPAERSSKCSNPSNISKHTIVSKCNKNIHNDISFKDLSQTFRKHNEYKFSTNRSNKSRV